MNYKFDSIVNKNEVNALKEMILKRAAEKSEKNIEKEHDEIMNLARNSFSSNNNPFSQIASNNISKESINTIETQKENITETKKLTSENEEIGFPIKTKDKIIQHKVLSEIKKQAFLNNMTEARRSLNNNQEFKDAIKFLNNQAVVSILKIKSQNFEALA